MSGFLVIALIVLIGLVAQFVGRARAGALDTGGRKVHSRPLYHGSWAMLLATLPALAFFILWSIGQAAWLDSSIASQVQAQSGSTAHTSLTLVKSLASGISKLDSQTEIPATMAQLSPLLAAKGVTLATDTQDYMIPIAKAAIASQARLAWAGGIIAAVLSIAGALFGLSQIAVRAKARDKVEKVVFGTLFSASTIAIITTIGIVLSMLFQTITFFSEVSPLNFFFGTVWDPRFAAAGSGGSEGQFGLIPLLAGTLYIALVALLVAVPVGLMSAVYMSEYAPRPVRSVVKPALELLAGIPTIVYGIFALVTLGPWLRDLSAALAGGSPFIQAQSIFTAGLVMGVMLIPVVSSLSDDIITAVPQAMRDGSLGLGATQSETIRKVILPAALPGIVGAVLLTASRAIGETMIVVLAAGVAANLTLNPFEAMTTITVKIVNQLTGDLEFNSPQTLVAFALGITLFFVTLGMNVFALYIVRKYREQYE
ncbi:phosphate ABC transporter permease subunit PstC [Mesorhizobium australicum]|uniref:Phosphate transport system permease protein n=1 Tax=Mesorhizobium australicum TaxID=536018 RepID=A0A1X7PZB7_9HYPH|nr:phosphate ABC transporter permease subunit PstC [Mesorhizobium australicum]SMH57185.1 phosphate ABC transporter membrane protein 1, PhoT family [Mesorhizobium australicum]